MTNNGFGPENDRDKWAPTGADQDPADHKDGVRAGHARTDRSEMPADARYMPPADRPQAPAETPVQDPFPAPRSRPDGGDGYARHASGPPAASSPLPQHGPTAPQTPRQDPHVARPAPRPAPAGASPYGPGSAPSAPSAQRRPGSDQYWGYAVKQQKPVRKPSAAKKKTAAGTTALVALVAALLGGAGGAGIMYGLVEPHERPAVQQPAEVRTVATGNGVNWVEIADRVQPSVVAIQSISEAGGSTGSGVIIDDEGHIITNHHVIAGSRQIQVTMSNGRILPAQAVGSDASTDLAVLRLDNPPSDIVPAALGTSDNLVVGEPVVAIGNPLGLSSTVTTGIISALDRPVITREDSSSNPVVTNAIQVDAAINPGNSGGPLFNAQGEVIGINSSIASLSNADGGPSGSIGLGFAIPIDLVDRVVGDLLEDGTVDHAFIGVTTSSEVVTAAGTSQVAARVVEVSPGSPAEEYGIEQGDAILSINGDRLASNTALTGYVRQYAPGETVTLEVSRGGDVTEIDLVLGKRE